MPRYRITDEAQADLDAIWRYVAERGGLETGDRLIDTILERFPCLADTPGMGIAREAFAPGLRSFPVWAIISSFTDAPPAASILSRSCMAAATCRAISMRSASGRHVVSP